MGMDVFGKAATAKEGEYFRNSIWYWRPLVEYTLLVAPSELTSPCIHWESNDGDGLDKRNSIALAEFLEEELASGRTADYQREYTEKQRALPRGICEFCSGTGIRNDSVGVESRMPERVIQKDGHPRNGETGWCNGCDGRGDKEDFAAHYPFTIENVREFTNFLYACGGFEIW